MKQPGKFCELLCAAKSYGRVSFVQNRESRVIPSYYKAIHALGQSSRNGKFLVWFC